MRETLWGVSFRGWSDRGAACGEVPEFLDAVCDGVVSEVTDAGLDHLAPLVVDRHSQNAEHQ